MADLPSTFSKKLKPWVVEARILTCFLTFFACIFNGLGKVWYHVDCSETIRTHVVVEMAECDLHGETCNFSEQISRQG